MEGVLSGNSPDSRVTREHVRSSLGSVDLLLHGDQMGELQTTIDLGICSDSQDFCMTCCKNNSGWLKVDPFQV